MNLTELLNLPVEELKKLSSSELEVILTPYYTKSRQPLLPPDKPEKLGLQQRLIASYIAANAAKLGIKTTTKK